MSISVVYYINCPVCQGREISPVLSCKDFTVSGEKFEIWECAHCHTRFTQNVPDAESIGRYYQAESYISHSDTDKGLMARMYKIVRRYTLTSKKKLVCKTTGLKNGHLLDVGCGTGAFLNTMKHSGWQVTGIEPDAGARKKAWDLYGLDALPPVHLHRLREKHYDAITLWHVLEHIHALPENLYRFASLLKPGGSLIIAVPNFESADAKHYKEHWAAYDVPRHLYHFTPQSIRQLATMYGFKVEAVKPMWFDAFYIAMLSEQYRRGKSNLIGAFFEGLRSVLHTIFNHEQASSQVYVLKCR